MSKISTYLSPIHDNCRNHVNTYLRIHYLIAPDTPFLKFAIKSEMQSQKKTSNVEVNLSRADLKTTGQ